MRVLISGAGLAGPCLAHGLRRHGIDVRLFERDAAIDARAQGYRIHINGDGDAALREWLPAEAYEQAVETSCRTGRGVSVAGPGLDSFTEIPLPPGTAGLTADRLTLRRIMLRGLTSCTRFGAEFAGYTLLDDGTVRVRFADGSTEDGDLLVAADGVGSGIRRLLVPGFPLTVEDARLIYGRTPLTAEARALTPDAALEGFLGVAGPDERRLALAAQRFRRDPAEFGFPPGEDYVMWAVTAPFGPDLFRLGQDELIELAAETLADWHPSLGTLIRKGDPAHAMPANVYTSERPRRWSPAPVTLVGDAAHPMPPAGVSAGVALHEAGVLAGRLVSGQPLPDAVAAYEKEMLDNGFAAAAVAARNHRGEH
ncbi:FAD-dependent oxidoreductase [Amycolatopsis australiensis]|uniref:2-polyprenyl-6-methoxyphenol hydroxylase n=1 Tax=Amycolatopsis australiensis TaxID=546364 RepID=A0A1K1RD17_9PSEU|nr:NAD(P)/FAD-dependent oxidoreductase [Amycolatopsis australiensis]SFW69825.1 2-polyprenyl-6-methoxyphenol hydroxylase [Amycolatopsis australiensis]